MISNIQRFCIHDGSGIRTTVFFKGCPLRCAWCANPETQHSFPELMIHHNRCRKCKSCIKACPKGALSFRDGSVQVDSSRCDLCGACRESCPDRVISIRGEGLSPQKILEIVRRDKPFYQASGGGMHVQFNIISDEILKDAQAHPEAHRNLVVRVAGYSAFFVDLDVDIQNEIISRTAMQSL